MDAWDCESKLLLVGAAGKMGEHWHISFVCFFVLLLSSLLLLLVVATAAVVVAVVVVNVYGIATFFCYSSLMRGNTPVERTAGRLPKVGKPLLKETS
jgi:hypothetical protein